MPVSSSASARVDSARTRPSCSTRIVASAGWVEMVVAGGHASQGVPAVRGPKAELAPNARCATPPLTPTVLGHEPHRPSPHRRHRALRRPRPHRPPRAGPRRRAAPPSCAPRERSRKRILVAWRRASPAPASSDAEPELAELEALLGRAAAGRPGWRSSPASPAWARPASSTSSPQRARDAGARVLSGECVELGESELPYAPIVGALRPLARAQRPRPRRARARRGPCSPSSCPARRPAARRAAGSPATRDARRARLFEVLLGLLDRLSAEQPVVLVIEDIHWADRSTRDFLIFLAAHAVPRARPRRSRPTAATSCTAATRCCRSSPSSSAPTAPRASALAPSRATELADQLEDILGAAPDADLLDRLLARSEGNPLFAEELLAAGRDGRGELPPTLRDALMLRVEALGRGRAGAAARRRRRPAHRPRRCSRGQRHRRPRALRDALREAVGQRLLDARRGRPLRLPPRAAARGRRTTTCCRASTPSCTARSPPRSSARRARATACLEVQTAVAHHWSAAGRPRARARRRDRAPRTPPSACTPTARRRRCSSARWSCGSASPTPRRSPARDHVDLLRPRRAGPRPRRRLRPRAHAAAPGARTRSTARPSRTAPRCCSSASARPSGISGRGDDGDGDARRGARAAARRTRRRPSAPWCSPRRAAGSCSPRRFAEAARALAAGDRGRARDRLRARPRTHALNTLGVCLPALGDLDGGEAALRESMALARGGRPPRPPRPRLRRTSPTSLYLAGRAGEARDARATRGIDELRRRRARAAGCALALGRDRVPPRRLGRRSTRLLADRTRRARAASRACYDAAAPRRARARPRRPPERDRRSSRRPATARERPIEPQWHGPIARAARPGLPARAPLRRRARAVAAAAVDRLSGEGAQDVLRARAARGGGRRGRGRPGRARPRARARGEEADEAVGARPRAAAARAVGAIDAGVSPIAAAHLADAEAEALRAEGRADPDAYARRRRRAGTRSSARTPRRSRAGGRPRRSSPRGDREAAAEAAVAGARDRRRARRRDWLVDELDAARAPRPPARGRRRAEPAASAGAPPATSSA